MTPEQIKQLENWRDFYWRAMLYHRNENNDEREIIFGSLAWELNEVLKMERDGITKKEPRRVADYENFKYGESQMTPGFKTQPSELEIRIRKEVMELLDETVCDVGLLSIHSDTSTNKLKTIKDRLNLLWGEDA